MANLLLLNGPSLNLLGIREPATYGSATLDEITANLVRLAHNAGHTLQAIQSNSEAELIERIHRVPADEIEFILFNPAAFTHTSIALRDALLAVQVPFIEIHLSNVYTREEFRQRSYFSDIAAGVIIGLGPMGYELALYAAMQRLEQ